TPTRLSSTPSPRTGGIEEPTPGERQHAVESAGSNSSQERAGLERPIGSAAIPPIDEGHHDERRRRQDHQRSQEEHVNQPEPDLRKNRIGGPEGRDCDSQAEPCPKLRG